MAEYIIRAAEWNGTEIIPGEFREEVIRCRDCKNYKTGDHPSVSGKFCHLFSEFELRGCYAVLVAPYFTRPEDFCAWAERVD